MTRVPLDSTTASSARSKVALATPSTSARTSRALPARAKKDSTAGPSPNGTETLVSTDGFDVELRRAPAGETVRLPASTVQVLEGVVEMDGDVYAAGSIIPLEAEARARAIGAATLLVTRPR